MPIENAGKIQRGADQHFVIDDIAYLVDTHRARIPQILFFQFFLGHMLAPQLSLDCSTPTSRFLVVTSVTPDGAIGSTGWLASPPDGSSLNIGPVSFTVN